MANTDIDLTKYVYEIRWKVLKKSIESVNEIPEENLDDKSRMLKQVYQTMDGLENWVNKRSIENVAISFRDAIEKAIDEAVDKAVDKKVEENVE